MESLLRDLRFAFRQWRRYPLANVTAILILALGIGANTANFSLVDALLLRPLPFPQAEELAHLYLRDPLGFDRDPFSIPTLQELRREGQSFRQLEAYHYQDRSLAGGEGEPEQITAAQVTPGMIGLLGATPLVGRPFNPDDGVRGQHRVLLLSEALWQRRFGGREDVVGRQVRLDGRDYEVIGVMPESFRFPFGSIKAWHPMPVDSESSDSRYIYPVGRLADGVDRSQAADEMNRVYRAVKRQETGEDTEWRVRVLPLRDALIFLFDLIRLLMVVSTVAYGFVLLIVCANVANLMIVRAVQRTRETAVRTALGAGRGRILRQFLVEGLVLALAGGLLGAVLAQFAVRFLGATIPDELFRVGEFTVDLTALLYTFLVVGLAAVFFSLAPAFHARRISLVEGLKEGVGAAGGRRSRRLQSFMVVTEVTLAVVLLVATSLMIQSFRHMQTLNPGFEPENLLTFQVRLNITEFPERSQAHDFYQRLVDRLAAVSGVTSAAVVNPLPLNFESFTEDFEVPGVNTSAERTRQQARSHFVSPEYFETLEIPLLRGRSFASQDTDGSPPVVVVNQTMAARNWNDGAVSRRLLMVERPEDRQDTAVIGVVGDTKNFFMNEGEVPIVYLPQGQAHQRRNFVVLRTAGDPLDVLGPVRAAVAELNPNLPLNQVRSMEQVIDESLAPFQSSASTLGALAVIALVLAAMGIYGVVAYTVGQSTREIGVRMALGADRRGILRWVLRRAVLLTGVGLTLGLVLSLVMTYFLSSVLFGVTRFDPLTFLGVALTLLVTTLLASWLPARRAVEVPPSVAMRAE